MEDYNLTLSLDDIYAAVGGMVDDSDDDLSYLNEMDKISEEGTLLKTEYDQKTYQIRQ